METEFNSSIQLPPGFRFHPSDEELIIHYLKNKATSNPLPPSIIIEVELYKFDPWELPSMYCILPYVLVMYNLILVFDST